MKTNSSNGKNSRIKENTIPSILDKEVILEIAKDCGFVLRESKVDPTNLIISFMNMISSYRNTYEDWASELEVLTGEPITKQAIENRMQPPIVEFTRRVLSKAISSKVGRFKRKSLNGLLEQFKNVHLEDSTVLKLIDELVEFFPGSVVAGERRAQAKIHAIYNMTQNNFTRLSVHSYSNNDQSLSQDALSLLQPGDLIIRDLGFTTLDSISAFMDKGVSFVARKSPAVNVYDEKGQELNLLKILRKDKVIDRNVLLGTDHKLKVRLVAIALPADQAAARIRKAKKDRHKNSNHSPVYYELLRYNIYITDLTPDQCSTDEIRQLYGLRWGIEIIFKSWKSYFSFDKLLLVRSTNIYRVQATIFLMLLKIVLFQSIWLNDCNKHLKIGLEDTQISLLKGAKFFNRHIMEFLTCKTLDNLFKQISTRCKYEKRVDRVNSLQQMYRLAA